jgi:general secretion pathway protein C
LAQGVRKLGDTKWEIQRSALNKVLGNTTLLARSARIVPSVRNGQPNGFKLYAIRPGSIYSLIGMQNGDTIHEINGHQMNTPDKALEVYTKVRNASHLSISFTRRGKPRTHDYTIR